MLLLQQFEVMTKFYSEVLFKYFVPTLLKFQVKSSHCKPALMMLMDSKCEQLVFVSDQKMNKR